ncbi:MAG: hypothetical protein RI949_831 [Pseudomonadota bacterium]|jgi:hypothetical protein
MAQYLSNELAGTTTGTTQASAVAAGYRPRATVYGARVKRMRATITLASQTTSDTILLGLLPAGSTFLYGVLNSTVSLGTSTLAVGIAGTTGKYRAAATFTATDTPTLFGTAATAGATDPALSADESVIATIATANLPASGTLVVDLIYSAPN